MAIKDIQAGKKLLLLITFIFMVGCVKTLFLSLKSDDSRIYINKEDDIERLIFSDKGVNFKLIAGLNISPFSKQKKGEIIRIDIDLFSKENIKCKFFETSLIDSCLMQISPDERSVLRMDDFYEKNKNHKIGLVFQIKYEIQKYIELPIKLKLPEIILLPMNDTIFVSDIIISLPKKNPFHQ